MGHKLVDALEHPSSALVFRTLSQEHGHGEQGALVGRTHLLKVACRAQRRFMEFGPLGLERRLDERQQHDRVIAAQFARRLEVLGGFGKLPLGRQEPA